MHLVSIVICFGGRNSSRFLCSLCTFSSMDRILYFLTKDKKRSYQVVVATLPLTLYLSYSLYHRVILEQPTPVPSLPTVVRGPREKEK
ncbi:hypothetical protein HDU91_000815 [Kappamyces sp. JEL0680]|nr:hypothetical protein HDU91_000815 [Kappamyces sp. JEL0680]